MSGSDYQETKPKTYWSILIINGAFLFGLSLIFFITGMITGNFSLMQYGEFIFMQVLFNVAAFVINLFINITRAGLFFLSALLALIIGLAFFAGADKIENGSRKGGGGLFTPAQEDSLRKRIDSLMKRDDSIADKHERDSLNRVKDSLK